MDVERDFEIVANYDGNCLTMSTTELFKTRMISISI
jgi:hypothetical protein